MTAGAEIEQVLSHRGSVQSVRLLVMHFEPGVVGAAGSPALESISTQQLSTLRFGDAASLGIETQIRIAPLRVVGPASMEEEFQRSEVAKNRDVHRRSTTEALA